MNRKSIFVSLFIVVLLALSAAAQTRVDQDLKVVKIVQVMDPATGQMKDVDAGSTGVKIFVWTRFQQRQCAPLRGCINVWVEGWQPALIGGPVSVSYEAEPIPWLDSTNAQRALRITVKAGYAIKVMFEEGSRSVFFNQQQVTEFDGYTSYEGRLAIGAVSDHRWTEYDNVVLCSGTMYGNYVTEAWRHQSAGPGTGFWIGETAQKPEDVAWPTWHTGARYDLNRNTSTADGKAKTMHPLVGATLPRGLYNPQLGIVMQDNDGQHHKLISKSLTIAGIRF